MPTTYAIEDFVTVLADHVPDYYTHSIRYFGLLAPRTKNRTTAMIFAMLGQQRREKPKYLTWAHSIQNAYGVDPLLDSRGERMHLIGHRSAS